MLTLALAGGCAAPGPYPSLAPRAAEFGLPGGSALIGCPVPRDPAAALAGAAVQATPAVPSDPELRRRVAELLATARAGQAAFAAALPQAERRAASAGAPSSDAWVEAQQELSRLEAARARTAEALAELDALGLRPAAGPAVNEEDYAAILAAAGEVQALARAQDEAIARVSGQLATP